MKLYLFLKAFSFGVEKVFTSFYDVDNDVFVVTSLEDLKEVDMHSFMVIGMYPLHDSLYLVVERR